MAQTAALELSTEWQADFKGNYNWINLLRLSASTPLCGGLSLQGSTISIAKTGSETLIDDLQGYSNIEEENLALAFAVLGAELQAGRCAIFLGIRNVNEDYFASPITSFFTNSSCGIYPTIAANYDIANYPISSWCAHCKVDLGRVALQTSVYEGRGHRRIFGHDNIFSFSPAKNGLLSITSAEYDNNGNNYNLGCAVYCRLRGGVQDGVEQGPQAQAPPRVSVAPWLGIEQRVAGFCSLMLQGSLCTCQACTLYAGAGAKFDIGRLQLGIFSDFARYDVGNEWATEIACRMPVTEHLSVQPALHIVSAKRTSAVGMLRLILVLP